MTLPVDKLVLVGIAAAAGWVLFTWCVAQERRGRAIDVVVLVFALVVVESVLWPNQQDVPSGPFNIGVGGYSVRLPDVLLPLALAARLTAVGRPRRVGWPAFWLMTFLAWYAALGVVGLLEGHRVNEVVFEAKAILYVGGAFALAVGVPAADYFDLRRLPRLVLPAAAIAALLVFTAQRNQVIDLPVPGGAPQFGEVGADLASVFVALGLFALALEFARRPPRLAVIAGGTVLLVSAFFAEQRAALLGLAVSFGALGLAWAGKAGRRRFSVTPTELMLTALAVVTLFLVPSVLNALTGKYVEDPLPLADTLDATFFGEGNEQSAQQRVGQLDVVREMFRHRPVSGYGLGREITYYATGLGRFETIALTHNIYTDLLMRTGVVGLGLFVVPMVMLLLDARRTWRTAIDERVAVVALVFGAIAVGLLAKGGVESILEKVRLAVLLGLVLGAARSAACARASGRTHVLETPAWSEAAPAPVP